MHGVVSLFDKKDHNVRTLAGELEKILERHVYSRMPELHLSYEGATKYNFAKLENHLRRIAKRTRRFRVHAGGLGIFTGLTPILYHPRCPDDRAVAVSAFIVEKRLFHRLWIEPVLQA